MKKAMDVIIQNRITVLAAVAVLTLIGGYYMIGVKLNADFATYLRQDDPLVQQYNKIGDRFGGKSTAMVLLKTDDIFTEQNLLLIRDLTDAYRSLEEISSVTSLTNVMDFKKSDGGLHVGKLIVAASIPGHPERLQDLKDYVMSKEVYEGNLISYDGTTTLIAIRLDPEANEYSAAQRIKETTERVAGSTENIYFGGMPFLIFSMTEGILESLNVLVPLMLFLLFLVLYVGFRTAGGVFLPLSVVAISMIWILGLMVVFGFSMDMLSGVMPVILLAMGSADCIHILKRYYERRSGGEEPRKAIKEAVSEMSLPMILTTLTSMVGFLSLLVSNFSVISQFGIVTSLGLFLALVVSFTFLPAVISFSKGREQHIARQKGRSSMIIDASARIIFGYKKSILLLAMLVVVAAAVAIPRIAKDVDWTLCLRKDTKPWEAEMLMRSKFKGSLPIQISIKGDIKSPSTLRTMRYLERYLETLPLVSKSQSLASVLSEMNDIMNDRFVVPETEEGVANLCFLIEGEEIMDQLVHGDYEEALIHAKFATMQTQQMASVSDAMENFLQKLPDRLVTVDVRQLPPVAQASILAVRQSHITDNIVLDLKRRSLEVERVRIAEVVGAALSEERLKENDLQIISADIIAYLLSDQAEVDIASHAEAGVIAQGIIDHTRGRTEIAAEEIAALVTSMKRSSPSEDIGFLSESLEKVVQESAGEARVERIMRQLLAYLPPLSDDLESLVRKDVKGSLWALNEDLVTITKSEFQYYLGDVEAPALKEHDVKFTHAGLVPILKKMEEELTPTQVGSVLFALVLVTLILSFTFRSPLVGFISVVPIILTVLVNFAIIGYLGIGLDSFIAMIASITIGLGVDYSVHFTSRFRQELFRLKDSLGALKETLSTTGVAIIINSLSVGLGFIVLMLGPCQHVQMFGRLTALTMVTSVVFTLGVLPALTLVFKPKYLREATIDTK